MSLMDFYVSDMKQSKVDHIVVRCRGENTPVQKLFGKHGFLEVMEYESSLGGVKCTRKILHKPMQKKNHDSRV